MLIAGPATVASIPPLAYRHRTIVEIRSHMDPKTVLEQFPDRVVYIGGGPPVWKPTLPSSTIGTSRGCLMMATPIPGSIPAWLVASGSAPQR